MRRNDREVTDKNKIKEIISKSKILHLGLFDEIYPYIVPLHFGYEFSNDTIFLFVHGAKEGHKIDLINQNPNVCVEFECDVKQVSGGDIPCRYGSEYASIIGRGKAEIVEDLQEKIKGLNLLMENQTGHSFDFDEKMADSVAVIKITLNDYTAKARK